MNDAVYENPPTIWRLVSLLRGHELGSDSMPPVDSAPSATEVSVMPENSSRKQFLLAFRVPQELNLRIDRAVLAAREKRGTRITKAALLISILNDAVRSGGEVSTQAP